MADVPYRAISGECQRGDCDRCPRPLALAAGVTYQCDCICHGDGGDREAALVPTPQPGLSAREEIPCLL